MKVKELFRAEQGEAIVAVNQIGPTILIHTTRRAVVVPAQDADATEPAGEATEPASASSLIDGGFGRLPGVVEPLKKRKRPGSYFHQEDIAAFLGQAALMTLRHNAEGIYVVTDERNVSYVKDFADLRAENFTGPRDPLAAAGSIAYYVPEGGRPTLTEAAELSRPPRLRTIAAPNVAVCSQCCLRFSTQDLLDALRKLRDDGVDLTRL